MANFTPDTLRIKTRTTSSVTPLSNLLNKEIIIDEKGTTGTELVFKDSTGTIVSIAGRSALGSIASGKGAELIGLNISGLTGSNVKDVIGSMKTIIDSTNTTVSGISSSIDSINNTVQGMQESALTASNVASYIMSDRSVIGLGNVTNDAQLKASQLEQIVSTASDKIPSSVAIKNAIADAVSTAVSTSSTNITTTTLGLNNLTNDLQLKASQLEQTVSDSSSMIPSSAAIASAISTAATNAINSAVSTSASAISTATSSITRASLGLDQVSNVAQLPASALVQSVSTSTSEVPSAVAIKTYVESKIDSALSGLNWQDDVINVQTSLTNPDATYNTPAVGDRWIITNRTECSSYFGEFLDTVRNGDIVKYVGPISGYPGSWFKLDFDSTSAKAAGALVWVTDLGVFYRFDGSTWSEFSGMDSVIFGSGFSKTGKHVNLAFHSDLTTSSVLQFNDNGSIQFTAFQAESTGQALMRLDDGSIGYGSIDINSGTTGILNAERGGFGFDASTLLNSTNYGKLMMLQEPNSGNNYTWIVPADGIGGGEF